MRNYLDFA